MTKSATVSTSYLAQLEEKLRAHFKPTYLAIRDDSHKHAEHTEAKKHGGYHLKIVMETYDFKELSSLSRQRKVYALLAEDFAQKRIHALQLNLSAPDKN